MTKKRKDQISKMCSVDAVASLFEEVDKLEKRLRKTQKELREAKDKIFYADPGLEDHHDAPEN